MEVAESARDPLCGRRLARAAGPSMAIRRVRTLRLTHRASGRVTGARSAQNPGYDTATQSGSSISISFRSPRLGRRTPWPADGRRGFTRPRQRPVRADDPHAVRKLLAVAPIARRFATTAAMRSLSFTRSSPAPVMTVSPSARAATQASSGSSSIIAGTCDSLDERCREAIRRDDQVRDPFAAFEPPILLGDARAHQSQLIQKSNPRLVHADALEPQLARIRQSRERREERRGRRIARDRRVLRHQAMTLACEESPNSR